MSKGSSRRLAAALALSVVAMPVAAQNFSDSYSFLKAVKERDGDKVTSLLAQPSNVVVNARDRGTGEAALHVLARARDLTWLNFLLARGARPDIQMNDGTTPLGIAAQIGWTEGARSLLDRRANVDLANNRGETPLILAVQRNDIAMVRLLLGKGAKATQNDSTAGYSAIDYARQQGARATPILRLLEAPRAAPRAVAGPSR